MRLFGNNITFDFNHGELFSLTNHSLMNGDENMLIYRDINEGWPSVSDGSELIILLLSPCGLLDRAVNRKGPCQHGDF